MIPAAASAFWCMSTSTTASDSTLLATFLSSPSIVASSCALTASLLPRASAW